MPKMSDFDLFFGIRVLGTGRKKRAPNPGLRFLWSVRTGSLCRKPYLVGIANGDDRNPNTK